MITYECKKCGREFPTREEVNKHTRNDHPGMSVTIIMHDSDAPGIPEDIPRIRKKPYGGF